MADKIIVSKSKVTNLFDSIRAKSGSTDLMSFDTAKSIVDDIQTGGGDSGEVLISPSFEVYGRNFDVVSHEEITLNNPDNVPMYKKTMIVNMETGEITIGDLELCDGTEIIMYDTNISAGHSGGCEIIKTPIGIDLNAENIMYQFFYKLNDLQNKTIPYATGITIKPYDDTDYLIYAENKLRIEELAELQLINIHEDFSFLSFQSEVALSIQIKFNIFKPLN